MVTCRIFLIIFIGQAIHNFSGWTYLHHPTPSINLFSLDAVLDKKKMNDIIMKSHGLYFVN